MCLIFGYTFVIAFAYKLLLAFGLATYSLFPILSIIKKEKKSPVLFSIVNVLEQTDNVMAGKGKG